MFPNRYFQRTYFNNRFWGRRSQAVVGFIVGLKRFFRKAVNPKNAIAKPSNDKVTQWLP